MSALRDGRVTAFGIGAVCGVVAGAAVVLSGASDVVFPPRWQLVFFYPGYAAGWRFYQCCGAWFAHSDTAVSVATWLGVAAVGLQYGLIALLAFVITRLVPLGRRRSRVVL